MIGSGIGVGVVGLGGMGHVHAESVVELGAAVVAGADIAPEPRRQFEATFDARTYDDHEALIADDAVDAVIVTTPNRFHEPIAVAALDAGLDVLIEKPLAHTLESGERIAEAAADADGICMVGFHNRHAGSAAMFDAHRERDRFGTITHVEANYVRRRGVPGVGTWFTNEELAGGGALIDVGIHALDLALWVLEFPEIVEVSGVTRSTFGSGEPYADPDGIVGDRSVRDGRYDVDDSASAFVRTADGRTISLEAAWATNREPSMDFVVRGTSGGAQFDIGGTDLFINEAGTTGVDHYSDQTLAGDPTMTGYREQDGQFLEAVASGVEPETNTVEEALTVQRVVEAIYRSSETGRSVALADVTDAAGSVPQSETPTGAEYTPKAAGESERVSQELRRSPRAASADEGHDTASHASPRTDSVGASERNDPEMGENHDTGFDVASEPVRPSSSGPVGEGSER